MGQKSLDVLLDDVIEEPLGQVRVHAALEGERDGKVQVAGVGVSRDGLELPDGLEVVKQLHVSADRRHQMGLEEDDVRVVALAEEGRKPDD